MRYGILFEVEIPHDYFLSSGSVIHEALTDAQNDAASRQYSTSDYLEIIPTQVTQSRLAGHKLIYKTTKNGFIVGVELDPSTLDDRPNVPPDTDFRLGSC